MGLRRWWAELIKRRRVRRSRVHVTWRTCRRCGSYSYQSSGSDGLCGGCRSLQ
jgi:hypothetical protein